MIKGITDSGFEFEIDERQLDNMEFMEALADASEDGVSISKAIRLALGADQKKRMYDFVRTDDGRVPTTDALGLFTEILEKAKVKNS